jgi:hypothetical protein
MFYKTKIAKIKSWLFIRLSVSSFRSSRVTHTLGGWSVIGRYPFLLVQRLGYGCRECDHYFLKVLRGGSGSVSTAVSRWSGQCAATSIFTLCYVSILHQPFTESKEECHI